MGSRTNPKDQLLKKIEAREAHLGVVGLGYVGLPLALEMVKAGFRVTGIDADATKVGMASKGRSYIRDVPDAALKAARDSGRFTVTTDYSAVKAVDAVSICVPTPLGKTKDPDISYIISAAEAISTHARRGLLVVLESTTYPGTTTEIILPRLMHKGQRVGEDFFLAFSPERVDPGNAHYQVHNTPKIVGGVTPDCTDLAVKLYEQFILRVVPVSSTETAEMVKLLENTFRSVNIGLVNEVAIMCDKLELDVWEVIDAAATKPFGFMPFYPGPGLGGHCIPIDPLYLSWKLKTLNYNARFIEMAADINSKMPQFVVTKLQDRLNDHSKCLKGSGVLVLGVAYKRDVNDVRESPALDIIRLLQEKGARVEYSDPHVPRINLHGVALESVPLTDGRSSNADAVLILTDHSAFDYPRVVELAQLVLDTRNATRGVRAGREKIVKL
jgi:UDP-N-acetyl-D-glucosamine dehydrogenase